MLAALDRSLIRELPLFAGLAGNALDRILEPATSIRCAAGDAVFEQGEPATRFFVLLHGRLRVTQITGEGQQVVVRIINPGDLFGMARALSRDDYPGTAMAVVDTTALAWPMEFWDDLLLAHPRLALNATQAIGQRLEDAHVRVREFTTEEVERRVAHAVLRLAAQAGRVAPEGIRIDFPISKQDIAAMTATTMYTVSRVLSAWQRAGLVDVGRQQLVVCDAHRLMMIGDGHDRGLL